MTVNPLISLFETYSRTCCRLVKLYRGKKIQLGFICCIGSLAGMEPAGGDIIFPAATSSFIPDEQSILEAKRNLTLKQAINTTLALNPNIKLSQQSLRLSQANLQMAKGVFDASLKIDFSQQFNQDELSPNELAYQKGQRQREQLFYQIFGSIADDLDAKLASGDGRLEEQTIEEEYQATIDEMFYETLAENADSEQEAQQYQELSDNQVNTNREIFEDIAKNLREQSEAARDRLIALGSTPHIVQNKPTLLDISYRKTLRNGMIITPRMLFTVTDRNYRNKPYDPARGGTGKAPQYTSILGFSVDIPLGKGSGVSSVTALEHAAQVDTLSASENIDFTSEESILATINAYWQVVASQERLKIYQRSARLNEQLVNLARALVRIDQLPPTVIPYVLARRAQAWAAYSSEKIILKSVVASLQLSMGAELFLLDSTALKKEESNGVALIQLKAQDAFPEILTEQEISTINIEELIGSAIVKRHDYQVVKYQEKSARILLGAARADTRKDMNLQLLFAVSSNKRSLSYGDGVKGAFGGPFLGPSVQLLFNMDMPFENNVVKGKVTSAYALWQQRSIASQNLVRLIKSRIIKTFHSLRYAREVAVKSSLAVQQYQKTLTAAMQRFNLGEATVIDTILSEERLTTALLQKTNSYTQYAITYGQFQFETGQLLEQQTKEVRH